jgi:TRAP transporter TAXI family solute receptor
MVTAGNKMAIAILVICLGLALMAMSLTPANGGTPSTSHPEVKVNFYCTSFGTVGYVVDFGIANILNKVHPWLRGTAIETTGPADAAKTIWADPKLRKNSIFSIHSGLHYELLEGKGQFTQPMSYLALSLAYPGALTFVTLDPKIQTVYDLQGKRISVGGRGATSPIAEAVLKVYGITYKPEYMSWAPAKEALFDGRVVACLQSISPPFGKGKFAPAPATEEILTRPEAHFISLDRDKIVEASKTVLMSPIEVPAGALGKANPQAFTVINTPNYHCVFSEFPDELAYELTKVLDEHSDMFQALHASVSGMTGTVLGEIPVPASMFHPGAARYFKEHKIKFGKD